MGLVMAIKNYGDINSAFLAKFCVMNYNIPITNRCYKDKNIHFH